MEKLSKKRGKYILLQAWKCGTALVFPCAGKRPHQPAILKYETCDIQKRKQEMQAKEMKKHTGIHSTNNSGKMCSWQMHRKNGLRVQKGRAIWRTLPIWDQEHQEVIQIYHLYRDK